MRTRREQREYEAQWRRDNPEKVRAIRERYRGEIDGQRVYFISAASVSMVKIGISGHPVERRNQMKLGSPVPLVLLVTFPGDREVEKKVQAKFAGDRSHGEWFRLSPDLLAFIDEVSEWPGAVDYRALQVLHLSGRT